MNREILHAVMGVFGLMLLAIAGILAIAVTEPGIPTELVKLRLCEAVFAAFSGCAALLPVLTFKR